MNSERTSRRSEMLLPLECWAVREPELAPPDIENVLDTFQGKFSELEDVWNGFRIWKRGIPPKPPSKGNTFEALALRSELLGLAPIQCLLARTSDALAEASPPVRDLLDRMQAIYDSFAVRAYMDRVLEEQEKSIPEEGFPASIRVSER